MKVVALNVGFYGGVRRRIGDIFEMDIRKKDEKGNLVMPRWVKKVENEHQAKAEANKAKKDATQRMVDGAVAASGGGAAKAKVVGSASDLVG